MPEQPAWRFQKLIAPMYESVVEHTILKGRVLTCRSSEVIEQGFVEISGGKIIAVGSAAVGSGDHRPRCFHRADAARQCGRDGGCRTLVGHRLPADRARSPRPVTDALSR